MNRFLDIPFDRTSPGTRALALQAGLLIILHSVLLGAYPGGAYGQVATWKSTTVIVTLLMLSGLVYLLAVRSSMGIDSTRPAIIWIFTVGVVLRVITCVAPPAHEDDFYRYLWDGGLAAHGINPYMLAPDNVQHLGDEESQLIMLREEAGPVFDRINHPHLKTIYPPMAQVGFTVAHWIKPWSLNAWRCVLAIADVAVFVLLCFLLQRLAFPLALILIYWWNPVLIKETYNTCHMDILVLPFLVGIILLYHFQRYSWASLLVAIATGMKLWPIVLFPLVLRPLLSSPRKLVLPAILGATMLGVLAIPVYVGGLGSNSGFVRYMATWEMNDGLYMLLRWIAERIPLGLQSHTLARILAGVLLGVLVLFLVRRPADSSETFCDKALTILLVLFLISPTQFPWYSLWFLPLLVVTPRTSGLLLSVLLPLYYMRFSFSESGNVAYFDHGVVWIEFVPVYILMIREFAERDGLDGQTKKPWATP